MELRHIRYFIAVAEELNFTRAAARLCIAQPPLSRQIQDLEAELGAPLFLRKPRALQLTEEGTLFLQYARQVLELVERSAEDIRDMKQGLQGSLYLASVEGHAPRLFSSWIAGFHKDYPQVQYSLWNGDTDEVEARVNKGLCDLGLIMDPFNAEGLNSIHVYSEPWIAMIPAAHPLAQWPGDSIPLAQLAPYELIIPSRATRLQEITGWFAASGQKPIVRCRMAHMLNAYELTEQNVGIAIYPAAAAEFAAGASICIKRLVEPAVTASYALVWSQNRPLSRVSQEFLNYVQNTLAAPPTE